MDGGVSSTRFDFSKIYKTGQLSDIMFRLISTYFVYNHQQHHSAAGRGIRKNLITLTITIVSPVPNGV